jgi:hypothetical protein
MPRDGPDACCKLYARNKNNLTRKIIFSRSLRVLPPCGPSGFLPSRQTQPGPYAADPQELRLIAKKREEQRSLEAGLGRDGGQGDGEAAIVIKRLSPASLHLASL